MWQQSQRKAQTAPSPTYALRFGDRLPARWQACGVKLEALTVQTDNGGEFGGAWNRRRAPRPSPAWSSRNTAAAKPRFGRPSPSSATATWMPRTASGWRICASRNTSAATCSAFGSGLGSAGSGSTVSDRIRSRGMPTPTSLAPSGRLRLTPRSLHCPLYYCRLSQPKFCPHPRRSWAMIHRGMRWIAYPERDEPSRDDCGWRGRRDSGSGLLVTHW